MTYEEQCVERGAKLLDEKLPGWADTVQGKMTDGLFDMTMWDTCIVGSLELAWVTDERRTYFTFNGTRIAAYGKEAEDYGFNIHGSGSWENLDEAWRRAVAARTT